MNWLPPEPEVPRAFSDYAASRGWTYRCEWEWPWTDPETGEYYEGYWSQLIKREETLPNGDIHFRALHLTPDVEQRGEAVWALMVDLAQAEFDRHSERLRA